MCVLCPYCVCTVCVLSTVCVPVCVLCVYCVWCVCAHLEKAFVQTKIVPNTVLPGWVSVAIVGKVAHNPVIDG